MDKQMIGMCGSYCGICEWKERTNCPGCQACHSKPFWGECSIAKCSISQGHNHCGHCTKLPCDKLQEAFDNKEHGDDGERLINLKNWASGKETYLKLRTLKIYKEELKNILEKFSESGWDLIAIPSKAYLSGEGTKEDLIKAIEQADKECGCCGCEFDLLYKKCIELKEALFHK